MTEPVAVKRRNTQRAADIFRLMRVVYVHLCPVRPCVVDGSPWQLWAVKEADEALPPRLFLTFLSLPCFPAAC